LRRPGVWEQRWHPFRGEWVLFASHRGGRPWIGATQQVNEAAISSYDPACALCPGNERLSGGRNPNYGGVFWFTNDLPCFSTHAASNGSPDDPLYPTRPAAGTAEVACYHPDHALTMADLGVEEIRAIIELWADRYQQLGKRPDVDCVHIFENKGQLVGTSNPHPHCQIYAGSMVYATIAREAKVASRYFLERGETVGLAVAGRELAGGRVVCESENFLACVPWFALFAYEVLILPRFRASSLLEVTDEQRKDLAAIMRAVAIRYDNLWQMPMPYIMVLHQAPTDGADHSAYPFHLEFHPPLRTPDTLKYLAGPETGGGTMTNESDPDEKAAELRAVSDVLHRSR
jgi:UDPglucose--hexose-1-phosphate uridylyltransferase